jgi:GntR family transcriptional regulator
MRCGLLDFRRNGREPLYHQLKEAIRSNIESGVWAPSHRLPNEFEVARMFGVSRTTVRTALNDLTREGLLRRRPGQGTFVVGPKPEAELTRIQDLATGLFALGPGSSHRAISQRIIPARADIAKTLDLPLRTQVLEIVRLRLERGEPIVLIKYHIPAARVPDLRAEDFTGEAPYPFLATRFGIRITRARTWLEPTVADDYEAKLLGIGAHAPCMLIRRLLEEKERPVVSTKMLLRGDKSKYVISWEQQHPT